MIVGLLLLTFGLLSWALVENVRDHYTPAWMLVVHVLMTIAQPLAIGRLLGWF
jgi:cell shape-determining protein MreD